MGELIEFYKDYTVKYQCTANYKQMNRAMTILLTHTRMIISHLPEMLVINVVGDLSRFSRELSTHEREPN